MTDQKIDPEDLLSLYEGEFPCLAIEHNWQSAHVKLTAKTAASHAMKYYKHVDWASAEEKQRALDTNSVWTIQWWYDYGQPPTPENTFIAGASTFQGAAKHALLMKSRAVS